MIHQELPPRKIIEVRFYRSSNGKEPVRTWLKSLPKEIKKIIGEDIKTVEMGWPLGMPLVCSLGNSLWEVRSRFPQGIIRVIFTVKLGEMILLHGFVKKSMKTAKDDMHLAQKRAKALKD